MCKTRIPFNSGKTYETHMKQWHQTLVEFKCHFCDKILSNWQLFKLHMTQNHQDAHTSTSKIQTQSSTNSLFKLKPKHLKANVNSNEMSSSTEMISNENQAAWVVDLESENNDDISLSGELSVNSQNLTSFPNQNNKHIDYVLVYEEEGEEEEKKSEAEESKERIREGFLKALEAESFEWFRIVHEKKGQKLVYILLNCKEERLLEEAEIIKIQMTLKHVLVF